ncbi:MAG: Glycerol-3-phosphate transporter [Candidatus Uhrbacteria bacterium GW2011_GWE2_45_35]|uniref:Glycerol-3-phosphate transporter n=1 Tax=Candidatus Uhrbacteria bacterium GW2011_GWE2_45_35 TaxID=1618993 RepID=A0A0G1MI75_9BACT|nr:MAG: Glycerol-3-phosphate transporter [Candidatus Uhrbacteria bacterium GW2011_GWE2_45_35]
MEVQVSSQTKDKGGRPRWLIPLEIIILVAFLIMAPSLMNSGGDKVSTWLAGFVPIVGILLAAAVVFTSLPRVKTDPDNPNQLDYLKVDGYRMRRAINWLTIGLAYAFLYWGRYNLNPAIIALGGESMVKDFHVIFSVGTWVYGLSFLLNGPLTDWFGGRRAILIGVIGAIAANLAIGVAIGLCADGSLSRDQLFRLMVFLYAVNMYFQSFGAVAIVKVNSAWFHVRERGVFGAVFGILIAIGIYFAYDVTSMVLKQTENAVEMAFFVPAAALTIILIALFAVAKDRPGLAGFKDFDTGDATGGKEGQKSDPPVKVFRLMLTNPVIMTVAAIEFCSGFIRQSFMQNFKLFAKSTGITESFVYEHWGMVLCVAGIIGAVVAGTISDHLFNSERGPVAAVLYAFMLVGGIVLCYMLGVPEVGWVVAAMSMLVIGVHGMLSGTFSQDIGGTKNAGIATGLIDGFVYAGSGTQAALYAVILPEGAARADFHNWWTWPAALILPAFIGLVLSYKVRHARRDLDASKKAAAAKIS